MLSRVFDLVSGLPTRQGHPNTSLEPLAAERQTRRRAILLEMTQDVREQEPRRTELAALRPPERRLRRWRLMSLPRGFNELT